MIADFNKRYPDVFEDFISRSKIAATVLNKDVEAIINSVEQVYSDEGKACEVAINAVRLAAEKITTILPLLSEKYGGLLRQAAYFLSPKQKGATAYEQTCDL